MLEQPPRYKRNPEFIFRMIMEDMILVPIHEDVADLNSIYTLNEVGAFLWEQLAEPIRADELERAVLEQYDAPAGQVAEDVADFISELIKFGAVRKVD